MALILKQEHQEAIDAAKTNFGAKLELKVSDKNIVTSNALELWNDFLEPATGATVETVQRINAYRQAFGEVLAEKGLPVMVNHAKANEDVGHLTLRVDTADVEFGLDFARPVMADGKKPTAELVQAGMACSYKVTTSERLDEIEKATAAQWDIE